MKAQGPLRSPLLALVVALAPALGACPAGPLTPDAAPASKWIARGLASYEGADLDDAELAAKEALKERPADVAAKNLAAKVALARLDYAQATKLTEGLEGAEALGIRGRALWYAGDIDGAAKTLERLLKDPEVKDPWAKQILTLTRDGRGRHPFAMSGTAPVASIEMPSAGPLLVVPIGIDDTPVYAIVVTGTPEMMVDSSVRSSPSWITLQFGDIEVRDVPALPTDLTALSEQLKAPIKALIGVNALRHLNATFDRRGAQFVVRRQEAAPPPEASKVPLVYARGGAMILRAGFTKKEDDLAPVLVDTNVRYPLALTDASWKHAGVDLTTLTADPALGPKERSGLVPTFRLGAFDLPQVPAVQGADLTGFQAKIDMKLAAVAGASLFMPFRVTFADEGRYAWIEHDNGLGVLPAEEPTKDVEKPNDLKEVKPLQLKGLGAPTGGEPGKPKDGKPADTKPADKTVKGAAPGKAP